MSLTSEVWGGSPAACSLQMYSLLLWKQLSLPMTGWGPGAVVKLPAWKVEDSGFEPHSGLQVSKKQNVFPRSLVKYLLLWGASVTEG